MDIYALGATVPVRFSTRRFSTGASYTLAGTPTVDVYVAGSTTQTQTGLSVTADYDAVTGLNNVAITASSGNGYTAGSIYDVVISAGTVDSVTVVGQKVYRFRIETATERAARLVREALYPTGVEITATTTGNSTTVINLTDVVDAQTPDSALIGLVLLVQDATDGQIAVVETTACSSKQATVQEVGDASAMAFTVAVGDVVAILGDAALRPSTRGRTLAVSAGGVANADMVAISTDTTAADNCEAFFDGAGYAGGTIKLGVDAVQISGDATAADNLELFVEGTALGTLPKVNTEEINAVAVVGAGTSGNKWRA